MIVAEIEILNKNLNNYRLMWLLVMYDLPVQTQTDVRNANSFRKKLTKSGMEMFQLSCYSRHCFSHDALDALKQKIRSALPPRGIVCMFALTDRQYNEIELYDGRCRIATPYPPEQLSLF